MKEKMRFMRKNFVLLWAVLFVAAMALPAMAVEVSISGYYQVRGFYQSNADRGTITPWDNPTPGDVPTIGTTNFTYGSPEAWWDHFLCLEPVFSVNDNL